jgi:hypothetical protein
VLLCLLLLGVPCGSQTRRQQRHKEDEKEARPADVDVVWSAIATVCAERARDPKGTVPIDEMAWQQPLALNDKRVGAGIERARRLLPTAKKLVPAALGRLAAANGLEAGLLGQIASRVQGVTTIKAEVEKRDNAAVRTNDPHSIIFGTIFLAGLRSDEAMLAVLAHELTHVADGPEHALWPLYDRVGAQAEAAGGMSIPAAAAKELTCELVGIHVVRAYVGKGGGKKSLRRRLARAVGKDCVQENLADATHLSPRETMRMLLMLDPELTRGLVGAGR